MYDKVVLGVLFLIFVFCACICFRHTFRLEYIRNWMLYDKRAALVLFGSSIVILLYKIIHLTTADFGDYRILLFVLFSMICALSFCKVRELLAIRGLAILSLFFCDAVLDAIYLKISLINNMLTGIIYIAIVGWMAIGAAPYLLRDWIDCLVEHGDLRKLVGCLFGACATITLCAIF